MIVLTYDDMVTLAHLTCVLASQVDLSEPILILPDPKVLARGTWLPSA